MSQKYNTTSKIYISKRLNILAVFLTTCLLTGLIVLYGNSGGPDSSIRPTIVSDFPIEEFPTKANKQDFFVLILSGDGGWTEIDQTLARELSSHGVNVAGIDSLKYFWLKKNQAQASADLEAVIRYYQTKWNLHRVILIGYSFGAEVLPYLINKFTSEIHSQIIKTILIGSSCCATFEIHLIDIIQDFLKEHGLIHPDTNTSIPTSFTALKPDLYIPTQIEQTPDLDFTCIYGENDDTAICPLLNATVIKVKKLKGGHHFNHNYIEMVKAVEADLDKQT